MKCELVRNKKSNLCHVYQSGDHAENMQFQFRAVRYATLEAHYAHFCNINAATIMETNEWPRGIGTSGKSGKSTEGLFE